MILCILALIWLQVTKPILILLKQRRKRINSYHWEVHLTLGEISRDSSDLWHSLSLLLASSSGWPSLCRGNNAKAAPGSQSTSLAPWVEEHLFPNSANPGPEEDSSWPRLDHVPLTDSYHDKGDGIMMTGQTWTISPVCGWRKKNQSPKNQYLCYISTIILSPRVRYPLRLKSVAKKFYISILHLYLKWSLTVWKALVSLSTYSFHILCLRVCARAHKPSDTWGACQMPRLMRSLYNQLFTHFITAIPSWWLQLVVEVWRRQLL